MPTQPNLTVERLTSFGRTMKQAIKAAAPLVIAGGAVRDVLNNRPVKDIDVFMQVPDWEHSAFEASELIDEVVAAVNKLFYSSGSPRESLTIEAESGEASDISYDIHSVWHWAHGFNNLPCDLVFIKEDPAACYEAFDFGLCQALVSPAYGLRTSRAYHQDALNRKITYLLGSQGEEQRQRAKRHLNRFLPKYSGWKVSGIAVESNA